MFLLSQSCTIMLNGTRGFVFDHLFLNQDTFNLLFIIATLSKEYYLPFTGGTHLLICFS